MLWSDNNRICLLRHYNNLFFFVQNYCNYLYVPFQIIKYCNYVNDFLYLFVQNSYKSILATSILHVIIILKLGNIRRKFCRLPKVFYAKSSVHIMWVLKLSQRTHQSSEFHPRLLNIFNKEVFVITKSKNNEIAKENLPSLFHVFFRHTFVH